MPRYVPSREGGCVALGLTLTSALDLRAAYSKGGVLEFLIEMIGALLSNGQFSLGQLLK